MIALLAILLLVGIYNFVDFGTSSAAAPAPATSTQTATQSARKPSGAPQLSDSTLDPRLRTDILAASQNKKYEAGGRNIFRMEELKPLENDKVTSVRGPNTVRPRRPRRLQRRRHRRFRSSFTALPARAASQRGSSLTMKARYSSPGRVTSWRENTRSSRSITPA